MNIYSLPAIISFTINFSVALIILLDNPKSKLNRWFSIFVAVFVLWNLSEILILNSSNIQNASFWSFVLYRIIFLLPAFFVVIAYHYPNNIHKYTHNLFFYFFLFGLPAIFLMMSFPDFTIQLIHLQKEKNIYYYQINYRFDFKFLVLLFIAISYLVWGTYILLTKLKSATIKKKTQIKFLLLGFSIIFLLFIIVNIIRSFFADTKSYYFLSSLITLIISLFFLSSIFRYNIFSTPKFQKKRILLSFISTVVLILYFLFIFISTDIIVNLFKIDSIYITISLVIVLIFLIKPMHTRIQESINKFIHRNINEYRNNFAKLTLSLNKYQDKREFFRKIQEFLIYNYSLYNAIVLINSNNRFEIFNNGDNHFSIEKDSKFIKEIENYSEVVELSEIDKKVLNDDLQKIFKFNKIELFLKLEYQGELSGIFLLSEKKYGKNYSHEDLVALSIFINEISLAYQRNQMIEDIQAEAKEKFKLEKLAAIGQMTSGVAHEIRNPLNTISIAAQTLNKKKLDEDNQKELLHYINDEVGRLERILKDFLKLSKIKAANIKEVDIEELIDKLLLNLDLKNAMGLTITKNIDLKNKIINTDPDALFQVLFNFGLNSYDAIKIRCDEEETFDCSQGFINFVVVEDNEEITIKVIDNGIGIEEKDKVSIFNPFFSTKDDGTGLGLSIAYNLMESLNSKIDFESKRGETVFKIIINKVD